MKGSIFISYRRTESTRIGITLIFRGSAVSISSRLDVEKYASSHPSKPFAELKLADRWLSELKPPDS
jgi:hypothetical protein